ncbi:nuclear transport factor 2 family protein [Mycobacterium sp. IDR2000157661]|uniref:nuclear transport factor 2 family protein n=1 Tax=Mycobacterium sp. IDR2000157661 TaxID=2867005 RepID=UPI001EEAA1A7|nr:nuclear transport factor 2 family protein [Mycobacterium sp. IDR2000157661]
MEARVADLEARAEILQCVQRYARGMDRRDRALLRSAYHDDAVDDHVGFVGPVEEFIDWAFAYHSTQTRYQHYLLNHTAEVSGDEAHAETYYLFVGTDREPADHITLSGGRYIDRMERRDGHWAIVDRVCVVEWNAESTNQITDEVIAMLTDVKCAAHDHSDPSYLRPLVAERRGAGA